MTTRRRPSSKDRTADPAVGNVTKADPTGEEQRRRYQWAVAQQEIRNRKLRAMGRGRDA